MTRKELLQLIAHAELAQGLESVAGMKGFYNHWTKTQKNTAAKILKEYQEIRRKAAKDIAAMLEAEKREAPRPEGGGQGASNGGIFRRRQ